MGSVKKVLNLAMGLLALAAAAQPARADGPVQFSAELDRNQISLDDSVSLKLNIQADGNLQIGEPSFTAPGFEVVNEYNSTYVESFYDNGKFGVRNNRQITKVLKPLKQGVLRITGIQVSANGQSHHAQDLAVTVGPAGAGTPPPRGYGGGGIGLRGAGKRTSGRNVILRAEVDKSKAYKGEQIIVSYYIYRRVRVFNFQVDKYPTLNAFLREDLEMPVLGQRLDSERVTLDGVPYDRSLLLRYAVYPLQDGKLKIDPIMMKYQYVANQGGGLNNDEDPFMHFFQQMTPQTSSDQSEPVAIDVVPLPEEGRPASFSGGVGDFNVTSAVNKYDLHANEAVTYTVKIEGKGNVAAIGEPKGKWPDTVELYDTKGTAKSGKGGVGEKVFEFLLIPRQPGKLSLPQLEFSFFDPVKKAYVTKKTEPVDINVQEPLAGSSALVKRTGEPADAAKPGGATPPVKDSFLSALKTPSTSTAAGFQGQPIWRWLYWLAVLTFGGFVLLVGLDLFKKGRASAKAMVESVARAESKSWKKLRSDAQAAARGASWQDVTATYDRLTGAVLDAIDRVRPIGARSLSRAEMHRLLVQEAGAKPLPEPLWQRIEQLLEYAETVRFASSIGAVSEGDARRELARWVGEGEAIASSLTGQG